MVANYGNIKVFKQYGSFAQNRYPSSTYQINEFKYGSNQKYSPETIVRAFKYFSLSKACYNRLRQDLELPSVKTLARLTFIMKNTDDQRFFVFSNLNERQKSSILLVDIVYVKP